MYVARGLPKARKRRPRAKQIREKRGKKYKESAKVKRDRKERSDYKRKKSALEYLMSDMMGEKYYGRSYESKRVKQDRAERKKYSKSMNDILKKIKKRGYGDEYESEEEIYKPKKKGANEWVKFYKVYKEEYPEKTPQKTMKKAGEAYRKMKRRK